MTQDKFQEHVLKELSDIKNLFIKNEEDHAKLSNNIESVRTKIESVRTEIHKNFSSYLRWSIGIAISLTGLVFLMVKYIP